MFFEQIERNKKLAFQHLVSIKKQDAETVSVNGKLYSYTTKSGAIKTYFGFNSFNEYRRSNLYPRKPEQTNGFYFVPIN